MEAFGARKLPFSNKQLPKKVVIRFVFQAELIHFNPG